MISLSWIRTDLEPEPEPAPIRKSSLEDPSRNHTEDTLYAMICIVVPPGPDMDASKE